jgi:hypothetical protein
MKTSCDQKHSQRNENQLCPKTLPKKWKLIMPKNTSQEMKTSYAQIHFPRNVNSGSLWRQVRAGSVLSTEFAFVEGFLNLDCGLLGCDVI